jgi:membrane-associated phospholipid phosphatase
MPALSRHAATRALVLVAALFVLCTAITAAGLLDRLDHEVASEVSRTTGQAADVALSLLAVTASVPVSLAWLGLIVAVTQRVRRRRRRALVLAAGFAAGSLVELLLKAAIDHPGPRGGSRTVIAFGIEQVGRGAFPSGHMLRGTALALGTALILAGDRRSSLMVRLIVAAYVVELAWTRVYLNEHWTSDVIGGFLLGTAAALAVVAVPRLPGRARG